VVDRRRILLRCLHAYYFRKCDNKELMQVNAAMVFARNSLSKPVACLPNLKEPASIVACCPVLFSLRKGVDGSSKLPIVFTEMCLTCSGVQRAGANRVAVPGIHRVKL